MITILLTRNEVENNTLKTNLKSYDFKYVECPLIEYENIEFPQELILQYSNFIITSKHAAKIFSRYSKDIKSENKAWVVGELSAEILNLSGIKVEYIAKNIDDLMTHLPKNLYKDILYLSANKITKMLPESIKRQIIYNVNYKTEFTNSETEVLKSNVNYIMLYSRNTAKALIKLLVSQNLVQNIQNATIIAISAKVAKEVLPYFKKIIYCKKGEHRKMIELLTSHACNEK